MSRSLAYFRFVSVWVARLRSRRQKRATPLSVVVAMIAAICTTIVVIDASPAGALPAATAVYGQSNFTNSGTGTSASGMNRPTGEIIDTVNHRLFVNDGNNNRILVFNLTSGNQQIDGTADYVLGQPDFSTTSAGTTQAKLSNPKGMAFDPINTRIFVGDSGNSRVMAFDVSTVTSGQNASYVLGQSGYTTSTTATTQSGMNTPKGVAFDYTNNRLFVVDANNYRVLVFDASALANGMNASYVIGQANYTTGTTHTTQSGLVGPAQMTWDPVLNYIFVADFSGNRVMAWNVSSITNGMNATYVLGQSSYTASGTGTTQSTLNGPAGVDAYSGIIWVADTLNNRVLGYDRASLATGMNASQIFGQAGYTTSTSGTSTTALNNPADIDLDPTTGNLYIGENNNNRLIVVPLTTPPNATTSIAQYKSDGTTSLSTGSSAGTTSIVFKGTTGDANTGETNQVCVEVERTFTAFNNIDTACGSLVTQGSVASVTVSGLLPGADYHWQIRTKDSWGSASSWVAYGGNNDTPTASTDFEVAGNGTPANGVLGQGGSYLTSTGSQSATGMANTYGQAVDSVNHRLFVSDYGNNRVLVFNCDSTNVPLDTTADFVLGQSTMTASSTGLTQSTMNQPAGLAYDSVNNQLYVSDSGNNRVLVFNTSSITNGMNASYVLGQANYTSNATTLNSSTLSAPAQVSLDSSGSRLFVADVNHIRVMVYSVSSLSNGKAASYVLGQANFTSNTSAITQSGMTSPQGVAYDSNSGYLYVSEWSSRVLVFNVASITNGMNASYVLGQAAYTTNYWLDSQSGLGGLGDVAVDPTNNKLFVSDIGNNRVMVFDTLSLSNNENAIGVLGQSSFTDYGEATSQTHFWNPWGLGYDATQQRLFVGDYNNNRVVWFNFTFTKANSVYGQSGSYTTSNSATTSTGMWYPTSVAIDSVHHRMFVVEASNNRVLVFNCDAYNNPLDATADNVLGQSTFTSSTSATTQAGMKKPIAVSYDSVNDRLYVTDENNNRVLVFNTASITNGMNAAYVLGQANFTSSGSATTQAGMNDPQAAVIDTVNNRLFVAEYGNSRVTVFGTSSLSNGMNASNVIGEANYTSINNVITQAGMNGPDGLAFDGVNNRLYVSDWNNQRVLVYATSSITNGMNASYVIGQTDFVSKTASTGPAGINGPAGLAINTNNNRLFLADYTNHRILTYDVSSLSNGMSATGVYGQGNFYFNTNATTQTGMNYPSYMAWDSTSNRLFVADQANQRVLQFNLNNAPNTPTSLAQYKSDGTTNLSVGALTGTATTVFKASTSDSDTSDTDSLCVEVQLTTVAFTNTETQCGSAVTQGNTASVTISGLTLGADYHWQARTKDGAGLYSSWTSFGGNSDTLTAATDFEVYGGIPANYVYGQGGSYTTSGAATTSTGLYNTFGTAVDSVNHRLFAADGYNHRVLVYNLDSSNNPTDATADYVLGQTSFTAGGSNTTQSTMNNPYAVAYDSANNRLFVSDANNNRVLVYNVSSITNGMNASYVLGQSVYTSATTNTTQSTLNGPRGIAYDSTNNRLYVTDYYNSRVMVWSTSSITNGMNAAYVLGQSLFTTSSSGTSQSQLGTPEGASYDKSSGYVYITDANHNRVMIYNTASISNGMNASYVLGQSTWTGNGSATTQAGMNKPVAVDATSNYIYVAEETNNRVVAYAKASLANGMNASAVYGQPDYTTSAAATTRFQMSAPESVSFDTTSGKLYVADSANSRVLVYYLDNAPTTPSSLAQYQSDGTTSISTGGWYTGTTMVFKGLTADTDSSDTNSICVEIQPVNTSFTNTETACGTAITQGGTASVTISGLSNNTSYHWQARTKDSYGVYSSWLSYGGNSDVITAATDVGIDSTAPSTGTVYDGSSAGTDTNYNTGSLSSLSANWSGFSDAASGIASYSYSIGTTAGGTGVLGWTSAGASTSVTANSLTLQTGQLYYINVKATDSAGNVSSVVSSNGQYVAPTLTFSLSSTSIDFGHLNAGNSYTASPTLNITTSTNAYSGYVVRQSTSGLLTSGSNTVPSYAGTYASPTTWTGTGFGYTSSDTAIQAAGNLFATGTKYAAVANSQPGDIVADHTSTVTGTPITNEVFTLTYKVAATATSAAGNYTATINLSATATF